VFFSIGLLSVMLGLLSFTKIFTLNHLKLV